MAEDRESRTEEPTQRRLEKGREEGQTTYSKEVTSFLSIVAFFLLIVWWLPSQSYDAVRELRSYIEFSNYSDNAFFNLGRRAILSVARIATIPLLVVLIISVVSNLLQKGILFTPAVLSFKASRISIIAGLKRLLSWNTIIELVKSCSKVAIIGFLLYNYIVNNFRIIIHSHDRSVGSAATLIYTIVKNMLIIVAIFMSFIATLDYLYQWRRQRIQLMMTKAEVKEEYRQQEGSPEVKSKLRSLRARLAKRRMMAQVPTADAVVVNPTHYAVALRYDSEVMDAPRVVAKGVDDVALAIKELAMQKFVPIVEDPDLARWLYATVSLDEYVRPEHYEMVAAVIKYVRRIKKRPLSVSKGE